MEKKHFLFALVFIAVIVGFVCLVRYLERKFLFQPVPCFDYRPLEAIKNVEMQKHPETNSVLLLFQKPEPSNKLMVFCHGNSGNLNVYYHFLERFSHEGYDVLAIEYDGFGMNFSKSSAPSVEKCIENTISAYLWAVETKSYKRKVFAGFSLGGSIATQALFKLDDPSIQGLILMNTFSSFKKLLKDMIGNYVHLLPLSCSKLDTCLVANKLVNQNPCLQVFIMHNMQDTLIPFQHSMDLYNAFYGLSRKQIVLKRGDHNLGPIQFFEEWYPFLGVFMQI